MAEYPSTVAYNVPFSVNHLWKTLTSNFDDQGKEKRRRKWLYPKRDISLVYNNNISYIEARTLWQFYLDRHGSYNAFSFFFSESDTYEGEYIGTGDGSTVLYDLPGKSTSTRTVYVAGSTMSTGTDYIPSAGVGGDGADIITFLVAPADGDRITLDFSGLLRVTCRFNEDQLSYEQFYLRLTQMGVQLKGLLNDE